MNIQLPPDLMTSIVTSAIFDKLTDEQREGILKASLANLVEPQTRKDNYGRESKEPSPLATAFNREAANMLSQLARERLETNADFRAQLDTVLEEALARCFSREVPEAGKKSPRELLIERITEGMCRAFETRDRY